MKLEADTFYENKSTYTEVTITQRMGNMLRVRYVASGITGYFYIKDFENRFRPAFRSDDDKKYRNIESGKRCEKMTMPDGNIKVRYYPGLIRRIYSFQDFHRMFREIE